MDAPQVTSNLRLLLLLNSGVFFHSKYFITNKSAALCEPSVTGTQLNSQMRLGLLQKLNSIQYINLAGEVLNKLFALALESSRRPGVWQHVQKFVLWAGREGACGECSAGSPRGGGGCH